MSDARIVVLPGGKAVLAENGPLHLVLQAYFGAKADTALAREAAAYAFKCLGSVAESQSLLRQRHGLIKLLPKNEIARAMVQSVRLVGDEDLTPMAAVAGTIADFVADWLFSRKATKVIVDNGGDIAIRLEAGESARVGLRPVIESQEISHTILLDSRCASWGVTTSGMGGRSLTRGIASAVTVFAATSSLSDAAATAIANGCFAKDDNIIQVPAIAVDPSSDLGELPVTVSALGVAGETVQKALENGLNKAVALRQRGLICGALLVVGGQLVQTPGFAESVAELSHYE